MNYCNIILVFFISLCSVKVKNGINTEKLIGGWLAAKPMFRYEAAILTKYNDSRRIILLCHACIIHNYLLLSAARCFIGRENKLKKGTAYAVVGEFMISDRPELNLRDIEKIYTYLYSSRTKNNDIAVLKLKESLELEVNRLTLFMLEIPTPDESFENGSGRVAGFGTKSIDEKSFTDRRYRIRLNTVDENELTCAFVEVVSQPLCGLSYPNANKTTSFCGQMVDQGISNRGLCIGEIGTPFVMGRKVVGIASQLRPDCNENVHGSLYTNVSIFYDFIDALKNDNPLPDTIIHDNPPYIFVARR